VVQSFRVSYDASGSPVLLALGQDNQVYALRFDAADNPAGGYSLVSPGAVKAFDVGRAGSGQLVVYAVGQDNQVYAARLDAGGSPLSGYSLAQPGQVLGIGVGAPPFPDFSGDVADPLLVVQGLDGQVYARSSASLGGSHQFTLIPQGYALAAPGVVKSFAVTQDATGANALYAVGLDDQVYRSALWAVGTAGVGTTGSYSLVAPGQVRSLAAGRDAAGNPLLDALGLDGQVYRAAGSSYQLAAPGVVQAFDLGRGPAGDPELAAVGLDGQAYGLPLDASGAATGGYGLLSPGQIKLLRLPR
jgi:hypothetical protein